MNNYDITPEMVEAYNTRVNYVVTQIKRMPVKERVAFLVDTHQASLCMIDGKQVKPYPVTEEQAWYEEQDGTVAFKCPREDGHYVPIFVISTYGIMCRTETNKLSQISLNPIERRLKIWQVSRS